jgi:hypothetical protein
MESKGIHTGRVYEPSPVPTLYIGRVEDLLGGVPLIPCFQVLDNFKSRFKFKLVVKLELNTGCVQNVVTRTTERGGLGRPRLATDAEDLFFQEPVTLTPTSAQARAGRDEPNPWRPLRPVRHGLGIRVPVSLAMGDCTQGHSTLPVTKILKDTLVGSGNLNPTGQGPAGRPSRPRACRSESGT